MKPWKKLLLSSLGATVAGICIIIGSHQLPKESVVSDITRDIGIAALVAGLISLSYEWSTRTIEKKELTLQLLNTSFSSLIPPKLWDEVKKEVLLRPVCRTNMELDVTFYDKEIKLPWRDEAIQIPEGFGVMKMKLSYDLKGLMPGDRYVEVWHQLDYHMKCAALPDLPCFVSAELEDNIRKKTYDRHALQLFMYEQKDGLLKFARNELVSVSNNKNPTCIAVERYEIVSLPGLYLMVTPEMIIPNEDRPNAVTIKINTDKDGCVGNGIKVCAHTWLGSPDRKFECMGGNKWILKNILLPGQGFSLIFSKPER